MAYAGCCVDLVIKVKYAKAIIKDIINEFRPDTSGVLLMLSRASSKL